MGQKVCSPACAIKYARAFRSVTAHEKDKGRRRERAQLTMSDYRARAQSAFNSYVRVRDAGKPCISCGSTEGKWQAGHYRTRAAQPALAYNCLNVARQCAQCNLYRSGEIKGYREGLVRRIGESRVLELERDHGRAGYTVAYLERLARVFNARARHLIALRERASQPARDTQF